MQYRLPDLDVSFVLLADTNNCVQFRVIQQFVARASFKQRNCDYIASCTSKSYIIYVLFLYISFIDSAYFVDSCLQSYKDFGRIVTFCVSRIDDAKCRAYCGYARLCVCVSVCLSAAAYLQYCTDPDVTWGSGRGCPVVVHFWADLQSVNRLRCYGNITRTLVYAECARVAD